MSAEDVRDILARLERIEAALIDPRDPGRGLFVRLDRVERCVEAMRRLAYAAVAAACSAGAAAALAVLR